MRLERIGINCFFTFCLHTKKFPRHPHGFLPLTNTSNSEQVSICLQYVHNDTGSVKEVFTDFVSVNESLAEAIHDHLTAWGQQVEDLQGQCYNGSVNMSGARAGCQALIKQHAPQAVYMYFYCAAHKLNLAIVAACKFKISETEAIVG